MNSWFQRISLLFFGLILTLNQAWTQCAMCKATVENNLEEGMIGETEYGQNINIGIIFLMVIPYIILFFAFRKKITKFIKEFRSAKG